MKRGNIWSPLYGRRESLAFLARGLDLDFLLLAWWNRKTQLGSQADLVAEKRGGSTPSVSTNADVAERQTHPI